MNDAVKYIEDLFSYNFSYKKDVSKYEYDFDITFYSDDGCVASVVCDYFEDCGNNLKMLIDWEIYVIKKVWADYKVH